MCTIFSCLIALVAVDNLLIYVVREYCQSVKELGRCHQLKLLVSFDTFSCTKLI